MQVFIYIRIVNHLTQQIDFFVWIFTQCAITEFNGIFYPVTKSKMASNVKFYGAKIKDRGRKILLPKILGTSNFFDLARNARPVMIGYIELFND